MLLVPIEQSGEKSGFSDMAIKAPTKLPQMTLAILAIEQSKWIQN
jgi:hypothetical protein